MRNHDGIAEQATGQDEPEPLEAAGGFGLELDAGYLAEAEYGPFASPEDGDMQAAPAEAEGRPVDDDRHEFDSRGRCVQCGNWSGRNGHLPCSGGDPVELLAEWLEVIGYRYRRKYPAAEALPLPPRPERPRKRVPAAPKPPDAQTLF